VAELKKVEALAHLRPALRRQLQNPRSTPGLMKGAGQLLIRFDCPLPSDDGTLRWERIDAICSVSDVVTLEPRPHPAVEAAMKAVAALPPLADPERFVAVLANEIVRQFEVVWQLLERTAELSQLSEMQRRCKALGRCLGELHQEPLATEAQAQLQSAQSRISALETLVETARDTFAARPPADRAGSQSARAGTRLDRPTVGRAFAALVSGAAVALGVLAMSWAAAPWSGMLEGEKAHWIGSLFFPLGFALLLAGGGELFAENFLIPATHFFEKRSRLLDVLGLWLATLLLNLVGAIALGWVLSRPGVLSDGASRFILEAFELRLTSSPEAEFWRGLLAGALLAGLTWLLLALRSDVARLWAIWGVGFLLSACHLSYAVTSAAEMAAAVGLRADGLPLASGLGALWPALAGNVTGALLLACALAFGRRQQLSSIR
jgi:formate/nitrite transporter FocA (FNT family)